MKIDTKTEPQLYEVQGRPVRCYHCHNPFFLVRTAQLNSAVTSFFNRDWTDQSAACLICSECGYIHWFMAE